MKTTSRCLWEQKVMDNCGEGINSFSSEEMIKAIIPFVIGISVTSIINKEIQKIIEKKVGGRT